MKLVADRFQRRLGGKGQRMPLKSDRLMTSRFAGNRSGLEGEPLCLTSRQRRRTSVR